MNDSKDHKSAAEPPLDCRVRWWRWPENRLTGMAPWWQIQHGGRSTCRVPWRKTCDTQGLHNLGVHVDGKPWKARIGWSKVLEGLRKSLPRIGAN